MQPLTGSEVLLGHYQIRILLEAYWANLDRRRWDAVAACFTASARISYDLKPHAFIGGPALAQWLRGSERLVATHHTSSHALIEIDGDRARAESSAVATLVGESGEVTVRGLRYLDTFVSTDEGWLIDTRVHRPLWQYSCVGQSLQPLE